MLKIGLTSITFRQLTCEEVIALAKKCGLDGIEWGTDVHVTTPEIAREVGRLTREAGLENLSVGSYYYTGKSDPAELDTVLDIADALGTDTVRIWAGKSGSAELDPALREAWTKQLEREAQYAQSRGIRLCCEYHARTLTDTLASAQKLLAEAPTLQTYWQPVVFISDEENVTALRTVLPRATNIHVFSWELENGEIVRLPLAAHDGIWRRYIRELKAFGGDRCLMVEFVTDDQPEKLMDDAKTLRRWAEEA